MFEPVTNEIEQIKYIFENYSVPNVTLRRLMDNLIDNNISATTGSWSTAKTVKYHKKSNLRKG